MQNTLPFVTQHEKATYQLSVTLAGPRTTVQFVAAGGRLDTLDHPEAQPPRPLEYPRPLSSDDGQTPSHEEVEGFIEHTAHVLYGLIQDAYELARVAARFDTPGARPDRRSLAFELYDEIAQVNHYYGEVLETYCLALGEDAAVELGEWLRHVANQVDGHSACLQPAPPEPGW